MYDTNGIRSSFSCQDSHAVHFGWLMFFVCSDPHFGQKNILLPKYGNRGQSFSTIEEHDYVIKETWNKTVGPTDTVICTGDWCFAPWRYGIEIWNSLNGKKEFVPGNHDDQFLKKLKVHGVDTIIHERLITRYYDNQKMEISHFPIESWEKMSAGSWHLHGHCHDNLHTMSRNKRLDIGFDSAKRLLGEYRPFSFDEIKKIMDARPRLSGSDHHVAKGEMMSDEAFKKEFDGQMRMFIRDGDRINFGRMEGLKDAARILIS